MVLIFYDLASPEHGARAWSYKQRRRLDGVHGTLSPDGQSVATTDLNGGVVVWDVVRQTQRLFLAGDRLWGTPGIAYTQDNRTLAVASREVIELFDLKTGQSLRRLDCAPRSPLGTAVIFTPDGKTLVSTVGWQTIDLELW